MSMYCEIIRLVENLSALRKLFSLQIARCAGSCNRRRSVAKPASSFGSWKRAALPAAFGNGPELLQLTGQPQVCGSMTGHQKPSKRDGYMYLMALLLRY